jgi:hypothetical protein
MKASQIVLLSLLAASVAFGQDVRYNFASGQDFSKYKTYKWVDVKGADKLNQLAEEQLKSVVDSQLALKGLTPVNDDNADLYIGYQAAVGQEKQFTTFDSGGWGYGPGWGGGWYGPAGGGISTTTSSTIHTGQLDLDMYDRAEKKLVWRGTVSKTIDPKAKPSKQQKNLNKAITKLLKNYPPTKK